MATYEVALRALELFGGDAIRRDLGELASDGADRLVELVGRSR